jgi:hypothetical protein
MSRRDDDEDQFGLDDFRWIVDDPLPLDNGPPPPRPLRRWLWRASLLALGGGTGLWIVIRTVGYTVPLLLLVMSIFAVSALRRTLALVAAPRLPFVTEPPPVARVPVIPGELVDGLQQAMTRWDNRLSYTERDADRFAAAVQPRLAEIVDERLRQRHGVSRATDPARARQLLGEPLWALLHTPVTRSPSPRQVAAIVAKVEEL